MARHKEETLTALQPFFTYARAMAVAVASKDNLDMYYTLWMAEPKGVVAVMRNAMLGRTIEDECWYPALLGYVYFVCAEIDDGASLSEACDITEKSIHQIFMELEKRSE